MTRIRKNIDRGITRRFTRARTLYNAEWVAEEYEKNGDRLIRLLAWWTPHEFFIGPLTGQGAAGCNRLTNNFKENNHG